MIEQPVQIVMGRRAVSRAKYPWPLWTNGEWHHLAGGTDYECKTASMIALIHARARQEGKFAVVQRHVDESLCVMFVPAPRCAASPGGAPPRVAAID
jgi:hypothetical protein